MDEILPLVLGLYPLIVSGFAFYWLLGLRDRDSVRWSIRVATSSAVICFAFLGGPWAFTSYSLRYVVFGLYVVFVGHSYWRMKTRAVPANKKNARNAASSALLLVVFGALDGLALGSRYYPGETVNPFISGILGFLDELYIINCLLKLNHV